MVVLYVARQHSLAFTESNIEHVNEKSVCRFINAVSVMYWYVRLKTFFFVLHVFSLTDRICWIELLELNIYRSFYPHILAHAYASIRI